jgi:hypothetical protein
MIKVFYRCLVLVLGVVCASGIGAQTVEIEPDGQKAVVSIELLGGKWFGAKGTRPVRLVYWAGAKGGAKMGLPRGWCLVRHDLLVPSYVRQTSDTKKIVLDSCVREYELVFNEQISGKSYSNPWVDRLNFPAYWLQQGAIGKRLMVREPEDPDYVFDLDSATASGLSHILVLSPHIRKDEIGKLTGKEAHFRTGVTTNVYFDDLGRSKGFDGRGYLLVRYVGSDLKPAGLDWVRGNKGEVVSVADFYYDQNGVLIEIGVNSPQEEGSEILSRRQLWKIQRSPDALISAVGLDNGSRIYRFHYDALQRMVEAVDSVKGAQSFVYWGDGASLAAWIDPDGCITQVGGISGASEFEHRILEQKNCESKLLHSKEHRLNRRGQVKAVTTLTDSGREVKAK